jgi:hypothetical protein
MGFKRSVERMRDVETRLRRGMVARGITGKTADGIVRSITSFALYGFPESHAASFALLAYASAYLRAHHLAAFTCAMLNNWPLGFYHPATLVKDAQRHGLRVLPIDVTRSNWKCTLEQVVTLLGCYVVREENVTTNNLTTNNLPLRLGLKFVAGLREEAGKRIEAERAKGPFTSVVDVIRRCDLRDNEVQTLAHIGAFAAFGLSRRETLWQAAAVPREPLFRLLGCYDVGLLGEGTSYNVTTNNPNETLVSRSARVAPSDGFGQSVLRPDEGIPQRGAVRAYQPDSPRGGLRTSQHRGRQRVRDEEGLRQLSADRPGQPAGAADLSVPDRRSAKP